MFRFFNSHTYLLSSVALRLSKELNDVLWFASLVLNEFSVRPTYVWGGLLVVLSLVVTKDIYIYIYFLCTVLKLEYISHVEYISQV